MSKNMRALKHFAKHQLHNSEERSHRSIDVYYAIYIYL